MSLRPAPLSAGARVGVVAPCSPVPPDRLERGLECLRSWGYRPVELPHLRAVRGHLAGDDTVRAADLEEALGRSDLRAVWVARGGFGATRVAERVDWSLARADPKPVIGFSDATALLHAAWRQVRLVTVHGAVVTSLSSAGSAARRLRDLLEGRLGVGAQLAACGRTVVPGVAEGPLLGGNLAVLCATVGTPLELDLAGAVVLLEDVNEAPYRVDRMLTQLRRAGRLGAVVGIALGRFVGCEPPGERPSATITEVLEERLGDLGVPVLSGLPVGHGPDQLPLPHGARVRMDAEAGTVVLREPATL